MANRHLSRICIMQSLYELDLRHKAEVSEIIKRNLEEKKDADLDQEYVKGVISGALKNIKKIDKLIAAAAPEWPLEQIARVDKNILRVAIFELLYAPKIIQIPPKVAIDEAVEIAKVFGGENSSKFVNGVLGTVYRKSDKYNPEEDDAAPKAKKKDHPTRKASASAKATADKSEGKKNE